MEVAGGGRRESLNSFITAVELRAIGLARFLIRGELFPFHFLVPGSAFCPISPAHFAYSFEAIDALLFRHFLDTGWSPGKKALTVRVAPQVHVSPGNASGSDDGLALGCLQ